MSPGAGDGGGVRVGQETLSASLSPTVWLSSLRTAKSPVLPWPLVQMPGPLLAAVTVRRCPLLNCIPGKKHQPGGPRAKAKRAVDG